MNKKLAKHIVWSAATVLVLLVNVVDASQMSANPQKTEPWFQAGPPYQQAALKVMLSEVNLYAERLHLHERFPISSNALTQLYIAPYRVTDRTGGLGNLHTANYSYGFGRGMHLTYITRLAKDKSNRSLYERFKPWKISLSQVDTNRAFMIATQKLASAFVDLPQLIKSSNLTIHPIVIQSMTTRVYDLKWKRHGKIVTQVGVDEATKELWVLRVEDTSLIRRKPLVVEDVEHHLSRTNAAPAKQNVMR